MAEMSYEWEVVDANWSRCKRSSLWLSTATQWIYAFDEASNTFNPLKAYKPRLCLPYETKCPTIICGGATMQGRRPAQEDRFGVYRDLAEATDPIDGAAGTRVQMRAAALETDCPRLLALVCDGHAGAQAADFVMEFLPFRIGEAISKAFEASKSGTKRAASEHSASPRKKRARLGPESEQVKNEGEAAESTETTSSPHSGGEEEDGVGVSEGMPSECEIRKALVDAFEAVDREFLSEFRTSRDGSTATAAVVIGETLYVANCGDSRAVLGIRDATPLDDTCCWKSERTSVDHKPDLPAETARITARGGVVRVTGACARVMQADYSSAISDQKRASLHGEGAKGRVPLALAVSRAFGDRQLKVNDVMIATPDVQAHKLTPDIRACIICSDGVWDVLSDQAAARIAELFYPDKPGEAASNMIRKAYGGRSMDNITCTVIYFKWPEVPDKHTDTTAAACP